MSMPEEISNPRPVGQQPWDARLARRLPPRPTGLGSDSVGGGTQPLRGFGLGCYYDRDSFSTSVEVRHKVLSFDATSTIVAVEVTPFIDVGRVFARTNTNPLTDLHHVYGVGFRGIARPFVVGFVDIGYGSEGIAAFTGLNYPF